jgi:hypothetical protein
LGSANSLRFFFFAASRHCVKFSINGLGGSKMSREAAKAQKYRPLPRDLAEDISALDRMESELGDCRERHFADPSPRPP